MGNTLQVPNFPQSTYRENENPNPKGFSLFLVYYGMLTFCKVLEVFFFFILFM